VHVSNTGSGPANDARLDAFTFTQVSGGAGLPVLQGRNPARFSVPLGNIPAGGAVDYAGTLDFTGVPADALYNVALAFSANGGRATTAVAANGVHFGPTLSPPSPPPPVSAPVSAPVSGSAGGSGGGGAPGYWFDGAIAALLGVRRWRRNPA
jgi:hypothetical protein